MLLDILTSSQEAEKFAEEDKATAARITARNGFENYVFSLKNQVNDKDGLGGKIEEEDKETVSFTPFLAPHFERVTNNPHSSSKPSKKDKTGWTRMALPPRLRTSKSRRRS